MASAGSGRRVVCFVCARDQEAAPVRALLREKEGAEWKVEGGMDDISLEHADVRLNGQAVRVWLTWPGDQGGDHMHAWLSQLLRAKPWGDETAPQLFLMTGVCAGERGECQLGDLMVATKAFNYEFGKRTDEGLKPAPEFFGPEDKFLRWVQLRMDVEADKSWHQPSLFPSAPSERDVLLRYVFARDQTLQLEDWIRDLNTTWLKDQGLPAAGPLLLGPLNTRFGQLLDDALHDGSIVRRGATWHLSDAAGQAVLEDMGLCGEFPRTPIAREPVVRFGVWGSGPSVRADSRPGRPVRFRGEEVQDGATRKSQAFYECKLQHRGTIAVEMEAAAFYQELESLKPPVKFLAIKGVCDFADARKGDSFHAYGKHLAAAFALAIVRKWVLEDAQGGEDKAKKKANGAGTAGLPPLPVSIVQNTGTMNVKDNAVGNVIVYGDATFGGGRK